jgi:hypothetical protein
MKAANRRCKQCRKKVPAESAFVTQLRAFCSFDCLQAFTKSEKGTQVIEKQRKSQDRERKEKLKTRSDYMKEATKAFNAYVRARDDEDACISCGNYTLDDLYGGGWDAGHYRSTGSAPHLRFNLHNCHKQCVKCNRFLSGNVTEYRKGLIRKIGIEKVEALESMNEVQSQRFSVEYLKRIKKIFTKKKQKVLQSRS